MSRIVLIRHGESDWNREHRVQGQSGTGLSSLGHRQAERTGEVVSDVYPDAVLVSSDLQRCRETAAYLATRLGRQPAYDPELRERHFGSWTGRLAVDIAREEVRLWERWRDGEDVIAEAGGESTEGLVDRVVTAIRGHLRGDGQTVILVTHGGPIWHGTQELIGVNDGALGGVANCSITELELDPVGDAVTRLVSWNQVAHLPSEMRMLSGGPQRDATGDEDREVPLDARDHPESPDARD
jgi:broad specificity phosphatase PhoE